MLAGLLVVVLVGGRWLALETAERAWAATFSGGAVLDEARTLARLLHGLALLFSIAWSTGNVYIVYRAIGSVQLPRRLGDIEIVEAVPHRVLFALTIATGIVGGLILAWGTGDWWRVALLASAPPHFGVTDEILRRDLGYYVGVLPWQSTLQGHALALAAGAAAVVALLYVGIGSLGMQHGRLRASDHARAHLAVVLACLALVIAWGAILDPAELVAGLHGTVDQAALDVRLPGAAFVAAVGVVTAIASLLWGWRDRPNLVLGAWAALLLAVAGCYLILPGIVRASRTGDETALLSRRAALERLAFGLTPLEERAPPLSFSSPEAAVRALPLWDAGRVGAIAGAPASAVALTPTSGNTPAWLAVPLTPPGPPRLALEADSGLALVPAPTVDTVAPPSPPPGFGPGFSEFAVASPDTWPALRPAGIALRGAWRRAALAWALQGPQLARAETDGLVLLWRRDVADRLGRLAPFATFGQPWPAISDGGLWWVSWGYVASAAFPVARALPWRDQPVRYLRAGLVGAVRAATGETHVWLAPGYDSLTIAWARHFEPLIEPPQKIPAALRSRLTYPAEAFRLAALQLVRANSGSASDLWTLRPREPFDLVAPGERGDGDREVWTAVGFEAGTPPRFIGLLAGTVALPGPALYLWRPGAEERLPAELVGSSATSPGDLRIWLVAGTVLTLQAQFAQTPGAAPHGLAQVFVTLDERSGAGPTRAAALRALLTGEGQAPPDTSLAGRWEQARRLIARADSALAARNLERFGQIWKDIIRLLAPAPRPR